MRQLEFERFKEEATRQLNDRDQANAKERLQEIGILNENGEVTEPYKGVFVKKARSIN